MVSGEEKLAHYWTLWFHSPVENAWDITSYKKIYEIRTVDDFWQVQNRLNQFMIENGMFFLMKENISPMWEDMRNKNGGCWSFKVYKRYIPNTWLDLSLHTVTEKLTAAAENSKTITGISISPKKSFSIIKIWNTDSNKKSNKLITDSIENLNIDECIYKAHKGRD